MLRAFSELAYPLHARARCTALALFVLEPESGVLRVAAASGEEPILQELQMLRLRAKEGLPGECLEGKERIVANDAAGEPRLANFRPSKTRSEACVPVVVGGNVVAILDAHSDRRNTFRREVLEELAAVAEEIGRRAALASVEPATAEPGSQALSEERYRQLIDNLNDPILIADLNARILWFNRVAVEVLGSAADLRGCHLSQLIRRGYWHRIKELLEQVQRNQTVRDMKLEILTRNGVRTVEATCTPLQESGVVSSWELLLRDVTEKVTLERLKKTYMKTLEEEVGRRTEEIKAIQRASILALASLAESIDELTYGHLERMRRYSRILADQLSKNPRYADRISDQYIELIYDLSPLHDIGKVGIRDAILFKADKLTAEEFAKMKEHTEIGAQALRKAGQIVGRETLFSIAEMMARFHHQWWDGTGYPAVRIGDEVRPLRGEEIPLCARVVALADVYDALTSRRPYKDPYPHSVARDMIVKDSGKHFDPAVVQAFLDRQEDFLAVKDEWADRLPETGAGKETDPRTVRYSNRDLEILSR